jgi:hypothetical protein
VEIGHPLDLFPCFKQIPVLSSDVQGKLRREETAAAGCGDLLRSLHVAGVNEAAGLAPPQRGVIAAVL